MVEAYLNPQVKVWVAFVKTNMLPTTPDTIFFAEQILSINVGNIMKRKKNWMQIVWWNS